ncbi:endospore germination permease [Paenibacillus sp. J2TS4]|uniref:GerAB/ArcD/ProY family transporter n=1 Tax=Paenibacillus sp. J2TS4 TaxID=2807194 RepID=UPI001B2DEB20|nr:endospore germination permease [Paenibacillus sp. J2TS4]GIP34747.1 spore germination protein YndE [Paenibacillus sp. J2TS4]
MERITQSQIVMLFVVYFCSSTAGFMIRRLVKASGYGAVWAVIAGSILSLGMVYLSIAFAKKRPDRYLAQYGKEIVGRWLHVPLMLVIVFFTLHLSALVLREYQDFINQNYLAETPDWVVPAALGICVALAVRSGIEVIFRFAQGIFILVVVSILVTTVMLGYQVDAYRAIGFFTHFNGGKVWEGALWSSALYAECFVVILFFPKIKQSSRTFRSLVWAAGLGTLLVLMLLVLTLLLFGNELTAHLTYPLLEALRYIHFGDFLENIDPLLVAIWTTSIYIKISLSLYTSVFVLSQLLGMKSERPLAFTASAFMVGLSLHMAQDTTELNDYLQKAGIAFGLASMSVPLLYFAADLFRTRLLSGKQHK